MGMKKVKFVFLLFSMFTSSMAFSLDCRSLLGITTDDVIYPGQGEVVICTDDQAQLSKMIIIKPVHDPEHPDPSSVQADERNPVLEISMNDLNSLENPIVIMRPKRLGIEVKAATLGLVAGKRIDLNRGGEVELKVLRSKIFGRYHSLKIKLERIGDEWLMSIRKDDEEARTNIVNLFFRSGIDGVKKIIME